MATIKIKGISTKGKAIIKQQYDTQKGSKFLMTAFKVAGMKMEHINDALIYAKKGGIREENIPQITGFLVAEGLKEKLDYELEVIK